jgi:polysaccharide biosynthesis/export protein
VKHIWIAVVMFALSPLVAADLPVATRDQRYRIQPTDRLELSYRYSPEYDKTLVVQPDGFASIELVGDIKLAGFTVDEARTHLLHFLKTRLNDPEITLTLLDYVRPTFAVAGHVAAPGRYEIRGTVNAIEAIAMAGGFRDSAKHSQVILFRRLDRDQTATRIVNFKQLTNSAHSHLEESLNMQPGDILFVPKNRVSKVGDYVHWISFGSMIPIPNP